MKFEDFKNQVNQLRVHNNGDSLRVCIPVFRAGVMGGMPCVDLRNVSTGIDWDSGKVILWPETELREIDRDEIKTILERHDELGWKQYKIRGIQRENEKLKQRVQELETLLNDIQNNS
jgi:hypothetical protein